jgi:UDP-3-O-[3-hydroxymyristoyl] glucosamine N-acyltransferase
VNTYIESGANVGRDTTIHPFTFIGRDASIGQDCTIGPFAIIPRDSIVPEGASVSGNISAENTSLARSGG